MQIIESSVIGVRSAVITLRRSGTPLRFRLFPMVHLAAPAFYEAVIARLGDCDLVVAEGIAGQSAPKSVLTMAYRLARRNRRLGLAVQQLDLEGLGVPVIRPDMSGAEFTRGWKKLPVAERLLMTGLAPPVGAWLAVFGSRELIGGHLAMDDLPTPEQEETRQEFAQFEELVVDRRDALVVRALADILAERGDEAIEVGVVYGAAHVPGIVTALRQGFGYRPRGAEWLTVFEYH